MTSANVEKIDAAGAFELLERVVAERGEDYVYHVPNNGATCLYVHDGVVPGCGVGAAAALAGVDLATLATWDSFGVIESVPQSVFDKGAVRVLAAFQRKQDYQREYGEALEAARSTLNDAA